MENQKLSKPNLIEVWFGPVVFLHPPPYTYFFTEVIVAEAMPVWIPDVSYLLMTLHNRLGPVPQEGGSPLRSDLWSFRNA